MANYPDDIRQYDNDPRSPFYEEPACPVCHKQDCICPDELPPYVDLLLREKALAALKMCCQTTTSRDEVVEYIAHLESVLTEEYNDD